MQQIVSRTLRYQFKPRRSPVTVPLAESQVKREWLPKITNINFELIADEKVGEYEKGVFLFEDIERDGRTYSINVGWGDLNCNASGSTWKFRVASGKVRLWTDGSWGRGCGHGNGPPIIRRLKIGDTSPNEIKGYEFLTKERFKTIRVGISTATDIGQIFGSDCEDGCDYQNWTIRIEYFSRNLAWTQTTEKEESQFFAKEEFIGKVSSFTLRPKEPVSFIRVTFPSEKFSVRSSMAIGDAWGKDGFEGAVHTSYNKYTDGYGLTYTVYDKETFNNLVNRKEKDLRKKGDLIGIEYSIPESLKDRFYDKRVGIVSNKLSEF